MGDPSGACKSDDREASIKVKIDCTPRQLAPWPVSPWQWFPNMDFSEAKFSKPMKTLRSSAPV